MVSLAVLTSPQFLPFAVALAGILGAAMGSFLTLVTYRLPLEQPIGLTRSHCPSCSTPLRAPDLLPIVSWLLSGGKCRYCKTRISPRYPLTEAACALGAALLIAHFGLTLESIALCGLWWSIVAIFLTDLEHYIILDEVQVAVGLFGLLYVYATHLSWMDAGISALSGLAIGLALKYGFIWLRHKDGLGMGDVKFLFVAGIWLGEPERFVPFLFFSGLLGIVSAIFWKALGQGERFPFGPALAVALFLCVLFPPVTDGFWKLYGFIEG